MTPEIKSKMVSARLPKEVVARVDFVIRNLDTRPFNRSAALLAALEAWLPGQETKLEQLGVIPKKGR